MQESPRMPAYTDLPAMDRKSKKPLMEKRRRARINKCLIDLKNLLLESLKRDPAHTSKLEKADILEMTVHLLRTLQRQQLAVAVSLDASVMERFQSGWAECAMQVAHYANSVDGFDPQIRNRLLTHLDFCFRNIHATKHVLTAAGGLTPMGLGGARMPVVAPGPPRPPMIPAAAAAAASTDPLAQFHANLSPWKPLPFQLPGIGIRAPNSVLISALRRPMIPSKLDIRIPEDPNERQTSVTSPVTGSESSILGDDEGLLEEEEEEEEEDRGSLPSTPGTGTEEPSTPLSATLPSATVWRPW